MMTQKGGLYIKMLCRLSEVRLLSLDLSRLSILCISTAKQCTVHASTVFRISEFIEAKIQRQRVA